MKSNRLILGVFVLICAATFRGQVLSRSFDDVTTEVSTDEASGEPAKEAVAVDLVAKSDEAGNAGKSQVAVKPAKPESKKEKTAKKKDFGISAVAASLIGTAVSAGTSLAGTTVGALANKAYSIAVSGSVENYSKFDLTKVKCTNKAGYINKALPTIHAGLKEGFASHQGGAGTGSWVHCSMVASGSPNTMVHIMYIAPNNFDLYSNKLALGICSRKLSECRNLNAYKMYYENYKFMTRGEFYYSSNDMVFCHKELCMVGKMGTSHQPEIKINVYAKKFTDAFEKIQHKFKSNNKTSGDYDKFINSFTDEYDGDRRKRQVKLY